MAAASKVLVRLLLDTDTNERSFQVEVWSVVRPKMSVQMEVSAKAKNLPKRMLLMGEACATYLDQKYLDVLDPQAVAKAVRSAYQDLLRDPPDISLPDLVTTTLLTAAR